MTRRKTYQEVKEYVESQGYNLISTEYINSAEKLTLSSPEGYVFNISWNHFSRGVREPQTGRARQSQKIRVTPEYANKILKEQGLTLLGEFKEYYEPITVTDGNTTWTTNLAKVKQGYKNKQYSESLYESIIGDILDSNDVDYQQEYLIKSDNRFLYFDFFIKSLNLVFEYDGIQHTQGKWHNDDYEVRDNLKDEYCRKHGITLVRIPYTNKSITSILSIMAKYIPNISRPSSFKRMPTKYWEINKYYMTHTCKETQEKFKISESTVRRSKVIFK